MEQKTRKRREKIIQWRGKKNSFVRRSCPLTRGEEVGTQVQTLIMILLESDRHKAPSCVHPVAWNIKRKENRICFI